MGNEKPILFNTEMVRAILEGRKTVTRRVMKPQPSSLRWNNIEWVGWDDGHGHKIHQPCDIADILWVRETWNSDWCDHAIYKADRGSAQDAGYASEPKWHPSIHMPREAARIFLQVNDVRVERLQDILPDGKGGIWAEGTRGIVPYDAFECLWNSTIKKEDIDLYGWDANPWVFVIEFDRCDKKDI